MAACVVRRSANRILRLAEINVWDFGKVDTDFASNRESRLSVPQFHAVIASRNLQTLVERRRRQQGDFCVPINMGREEPADVTAIG
jgi:hypothetical protein